MSKQPPSAPTASTVSPCQGNCQKRMIKQLQFPLYAKTEFYGVNSVRFSFSIIHFDI